MKILLLGPDARNSRIKTFLTDQGHSVMGTTDSITLEFARQNNIEFIISSGYAPIIKKQVISGYLNRIINLHNSFLPYGKGIYPIVWSFLEGAPNGVSIHFIDEGIDSGDIICQREVILTDSETLSSSNDRLVMELEDLFFEYWGKMDDQSYEAVHQPDMSSQTWYHSRLDAEKVMDLLPKRWETTIDEVKELGVGLSLSSDFWKTYDDEISADFSN